MKKRAISLFLMAGIVFCSGSVIVKGVTDFYKASNVVNSSIKTADCYALDPGNVEPLNDPGNVEPMAPKTGNA